MKLSLQPSLTKVTKVIQQQSFDADSDLNNARRLIIQVDAVCSLTLNFVIDVSLYSRTIPVAMECLVFCGVKSLYMCTVGL